MTTAYPLSWPAGRPRTPAHQRKRSTFSSNGYELTLADARVRLQDELERLGATSIILSSNIELRLDGLPRSGRPAPQDVGVALYFQLNGRDTVFACDRWDRAPDNIAAIAKHIEALRGMDRWGVGSIEQAFAGYQALPSPVRTAPLYWAWLLGVAEDASDQEIDAAWREKMRTAHPDRGGSAEEAQRLNAARAEGKRRS